MAEQKIMIIAGEPSGDLHGSQLAKSLKELQNNIKLFGVGGDLMRKSSVEILRDIKDLSVFGIFSVIRNLNKFISLQKFLLKKIEEEKPLSIILIDFGGFNLRLAKKINKQIPVIYYISPQIWASRSGRIKTIKKYIDKMIVIFKFEEDFYKEYGIDVSFVGHPLIDIAKPYFKKEELQNKFKLPEDKLTIGLLPGSRKSAVSKNLPIMLKTCLLLKKERKNLQFIISKVKNLEKGVYLKIIEPFNLDLKILETNIYDFLNLTDFCLVSSGTVTIDCAIMEKPFVIIYKMGILNYLFYRPQIRIPYIGMINIVAGKKIIEEFIQFNAEPKIIAQVCLEILTNSQRMHKIREDLKLLKEKLGPLGASKQAARIIFEEIEKRS